MCCQLTAVHGQRIQRAQPGGSLAAGKSWIKATFPCAVCQYLEPEVHMVQRCADWSPGTIYVPLLAVPTRAAHTGGVLLAGGFWML